MSGVVVLNSSDVDDGAAEPRVQFVECAEDATVRRGYF